jgi:hypothetical protein
VYIKEQQVLPNINQWIESPTHAELYQTQRKINPHNVHIGRAERQKFLGTTESENIKANTRMSALNICKASLKQCLPSTTSGSHTIDNHTTSMTRFRDIATTIKRGRK